ncbi:MAG: DUF480 domain-containing protein [bacterium]|nr:DUF480 domain-containing protein [bacterium]
MEITLTPIEARVLGSLIEKEKTTPEYYPLTLNALANACNQKSNRSPVMNCEEQEIEQALATLREKKLLWQVMTSGSRTQRYKHDMETVFKFSPPEMAAICLLLVRGPQTLGEIKNRSDRLHQFASLEEVETVLEGLMQNPEGPYVVKLPRITGHKERRYGHLLCGEIDAAELEAGSGEAAPENERVQSLEQRMDALEAELAALQKQYDEWGGRK